MVTARKPRRPARATHRETSAEKFARIRKERVGTHVRLSKADARYILRRLAGSDPHAPRGEDVIQNVRGDWGERLDILSKT
jgi:hypothetical protein